MPQAKTEATCCAAIFGMLRCRSCTATLAFLQCGCHFDQKLRCSKRKIATLESCVARKCREEKSVHHHHRKKIFWRTFLASKKNFSGRWWIQKHYRNQENHIYHQNLSYVAPIFLGKEKFCSVAGRCMLSFSQKWRFPAAFLRMSGSHV